jgi:hypothetical protein
MNVIGRGGKKKHTYKQKKSMSNPPTSDVAIARPRQRRPAVPTTPPYMANRARRLVMASKRGTYMLRKAHEYDACTGGGVLVLVVTESGTLRCYATPEFIPDVWRISLRYPRSTRHVAGTISALPASSRAPMYDGGAGGTFDRVTVGGAERLTALERAQLAAGPIRHARDPFLH